MVLSSHALPDGRLHETTEGRQYVDGWVYLTIVKLTVDVDLSLSNVSSQIRNGMSDIYGKAGDSGKSTFDINRSP